MKRLFLLIPPIIHLALSLAFPFVYWPEMLNYPLFLNHGWLPYQDISMVYTPLLPYLLAFFYTIFGETTSSLHLFGTLIGLLTTFLLTSLVWQRTKSRQSSLFAGISFTIIFLAFQGNSVWFDIVLSPLILLMFFIATNSAASRRSLPFTVLGFLFGLAFLTKQTAAYLLLPISTLFLVFAKKTNWQLFLKSLFTFLTPVALILLGLFAFLSLNDLIPSFYKWSIKFVFLLPFFKGESGNLSPDILWPTFRQTAVVIALALILGLSLLKKKLSLIELSFLLGALLFAFPRFDYFHLIPALTIFVFLIATRRPTFLLLAVLVVSPVLLKTYQLGDRFLEPEIQLVAKDLRENYPFHSFFVMNGPDQLYFLTGKLPATRPWYDQLPWQLAYDSAGFTASFVSASPEIIIFKPYLEKPVQGLGAYQPESVVSLVKRDYSIIKEYRGNLFLLKRTN